MRRIMSGAMLALIAAPASGAPRAPVAKADGDTGAVARLRAQNDVLRERMGQVQLDTLIEDVLRRQDGKTAAPRRDAGLPPQVVAFRK